MGRCPPRKKGCRRWCGALPCLAGGLEAGNRLFPVYIYPALGTKLPPLTRVCVLWCLLRCPGPQAVTADVGSTPSVPNNSVNSSKKTNWDLLGCNSDPLCRNLAAVHLVPTPGLLVFESLLPLGVNSLALFVLRSDSSMRYLHSAPRWRVAVTL